MCCRTAAERHAFVRHCVAFSGVLVSNTLAAAPVLVFLVTAAAVADGYFAPSTRYVYELWTLNGTGAVNASLFMTLSEPLAPVGTNSTPQSWENTDVWVNFSREIPPGRYFNQSWTLPIPGYPGAPGIAVAVGGALILANIFWLYASRRTHAASRAGAWYILRIVGGAILGAMVAFLPDTPELVNSTQALDLPASAFSAGVASDGLTFAFGCLLAMSVFNLVFSISQLAATPSLWSPDASWLPEAIASFFFVIQFALALAKTSPGSFELSVPWAVILTPTWMMLIINFCGWFAWTCMAFDESGFEENVGAISAILVATIAVYTCTAATLILLCQNDGLVFAQQSLWPKTWLTVVEPLVVAWLFLFLLACANPVVQCVEKARRCREALGKARSDYRREIHEFQEHRVSNTECLLNLDQRRAVTNGQEEPSDPETQALLSLLNMLKSLELPSTHRTFQPTDMLKLLQRMNLLLQTHPGTATSETRVAVVTKFESFRERHTAFDWNSEIASAYRELLWRFTAAAQLLQKRPSLNGLRKASALGPQPPPPPLSDF